MMGDDEVEIAKRIQVRETPPKRSKRCSRMEHGLPSIASSVPDSQGLFGMFHF
jgi:hypothetical protein